MLHSGKMAREHKGRQNVHGEDILMVDAKKLLIANDAVDPISGSVPHRSQRCRVRKEGIPASAVEEER